jgi:rhomboid protease GluP
MSVTPSHEGDVLTDERPPVRIKLPDSQPTVTYILLGFTILIYLLQTGTQLLLGADLPAAYGMKINSLIQQGQYWRLLTPMFLHGSILHLGFNMYALYILGRRVEQFFGHGRFLALYSISALAGNVLSMALTASPSLGSSTAIFGLLGAEAAFIYQHRQLLGDQAGSALRQIIQVAVINLIIGLSPGIDNWGHVGGLIGGAAFTWWGGPHLKVTGIYPLHELEDTRDQTTTFLIFAILLICLVGLAGGLIYLRNNT